MSQVAFNSLVSDSVALGEVKTYEITIPKSAKYVVELAGPANTLFGIWKGSVSPANGMLRICGVGKRGTRTLDAGPHVIQVTGNTAGAFTFKVRPWSFSDYVTIGFYKSSC